MDADQEVAAWLTVTAIEWLQEQEDVQLKRDADSVGSVVGTLYDAVLKRVKSAHNPSTE